MWIFIFPETLLGDEAQIFWIYYLFSLFMWTRKFQFPVQLGECIKAGAKPVRTVSHRSCQEHSAAAAPLDSPLKGNKTFFIIQGPFSFLFQKMISDSRLIKISVPQVLIRILKKIRKVSNNFFPIKSFFDKSQLEVEEIPRHLVCLSRMFWLKLICVFSDKIHIRTNLPLSSSLAPVASGKFNITNYKIGISTKKKENIFCTAISSSFLACLIYHFLHHLTHPS